MCPGCLVALMGTDEAEMTSDKDLLYAGAILAAAVVLAVLISKR